MATHRPAVRRHAGGVEPTFVAPGGDLLAEHALRVVGGAVAGPEGAAAVGPGEDERRDAGLHGGGEELAEPEGLVARGRRGGAVQDQADGQPLPVAVPLRARP